MIRITEASRGTLLHPVVSKPSVDDHGAVTDRVATANPARDFV
jgi:hypothetical protein